MGSGQSARKLTISNEEEVGVIKVSNAIVQRLAQAERSGTSESFSNMKSGTPNEHLASQNTPIVTPHTTDTASGQPVNYPELTMSALQMQQQMEQELKLQEQHWQKRLKNIENSYQKINHILNDEYEKIVAEISTANAGQKSVNIQCTQPCLENSNKVLKCFQDHPKETLKCSDLVEEFSNCVWNVHYPRVIEVRS